MRRSWNTLRSQSRRTSLRCRRVGMAALEVVLATGLMFPAVVFLAYFGIRSCRQLFGLIGSMIGSPYM